MGVPSEKLRNSRERALRVVEYLQGGQTNTAQLRNMSREYLREIAERALQALEALGADEDTACGACGGTGEAR